MAVSSKTVFAYLKTSFDQPQAMLENLIEDALDVLAETPLGPIQKSEMVSDLVGKVRDEVQRYISKCQALGIVPDFEFGTHRSCLINKKVDLFGARKDFYEWLYALHPQKFESLCQKILILEGCNNVKTTPYSGDGGVDFYGTKQVALADEDNPAVFKSVEVSVIGQAKRYAIGNKINIEQLRCFVGSYNLMNLAQMKDSPPQLHNPIKTESFKPLSPTLLTFITSSEADEPTRQTAQWLGIKLIGGQELVEIFYSKSIGFRRHKSGVVFEPSDFISL